MKTLSFLVSLFVSFSVFAQEFNLTGEFRPRAEYYSVDVPILNWEPSAYITQRTRLNFDYKNSENKIRTYASLQAARIWGSTSMKEVGNEEHFGFYEAWGEYMATEKLSLRVGRQVLSYDDKRIFGESDFDPQGRSHDAAVLRYEGKFKLHAGFSMNYKADNLLWLHNVPYGEPNNFRNMQYVHFNKKTKAYSISALFVNNGYETDKVMPIDSVYYSQTIGSSFGFSPHPIARIKGNVFYQMGNDNKGRVLSAYNANLGLLVHAVPRKLMVEAGYDLFSGNEVGTPADENNSFTLLYGDKLALTGISGFFLTQHVAGGNAYNRGFSKTYFNATLLAGKLIVVSKLNLINTQNPIMDAAGAEMSSQMAIEETVAIIYRLSKEIAFTFIGGYVNMSETMRTYLGGLPVYGTSHGYMVAGLTFKPTFLTHKKE